MIKAPPQRDTNARKQEKDIKSSVSRLYRASVQLAQRLDILCKSTSDWKELFQSETLGIRQRLKSNCESLLFTNPKDYGRKAEELLWRKVFYDVIQWLRQQRKVSDDDPELDSACRSHLLSASGYYFHLLLKLQQHYAIKLDSVVSWSCTNIKDQPSEYDVEVNEWAIKACQRCLLSLGDLARYQQEFEGTTKNIKLAERFYMEAFHLNPDLGMPHNQLGTLLGGLYCGCEGVYHYMRCMMCKEVFDGTEGNLLRLFEKNRTIVMSMKELPLNASIADKVKRFLVYFVYLQDVLYTKESTHKVASEEIGQLCQSVLQDMEAALSIDKPALSIDKPALNENGDHQQVQVNGEVTNGKRFVADDVKGIELTGSLMVKVAGIMIMTLTRLKLEGSPEAPVATAFTLAFLSQLLQQCITSIEHDTSKATSRLTNGKKNGDFHNEKHEKLEKVRKIKKTIKMRRRRRKRSDLSNSFDSCSLSDSDTLEVDSGDESDLSEGGLDDLDSEDSDDVYVESESDEESSAAMSVKKESSSCNGNSLIEAGRLLTQQIMKDNLAMKNAVSFGKVTQYDASDVSDVETECSVASWGRIEELEELAVVRGLLNKKLLPAIKVMTDWLAVNPDTISTCVESSTTLWSKMAVLLNLLPTQEQLKSTAVGKSALWKDIVSQEIDEKWSQNYALPEDVCMFGFEPMMKVYNSLQLQWIRPPREGRCIEAIIRTMSLRNFGIQLAKMKALNFFVWDESKQTFMGPNQCMEQEKKENERTKQEAANRRSQVMRAMAHQRMQSEVSKLEKSLKSVPKGTTAYLVPDAPALCTLLHLIRRLVTMEKFLIIIPIQVIEALDELKKFDTGARESIKYLEGEFKKGNRWIRAQKENETAESTRRRGRYDDVSVWRFNQVVNCCRFLINQTAKGLVTLLTGGNIAEKPSKKGRRTQGAASGTQATPELVEFARNCGIHVESLRSFCARYTSTRSIT